MQRIAIHSVPRSGSTWLGQIFNSHPNVVFRFQPLFSYAFKDTLSPQSSKEEIIDFFKAIKDSEDSFVTQKEEIEKGIIPKFDKSNELTHICYKEVRYHHILENLLNKDPEVKVIGLIRNPLAVISSWLKAPKEFRKELGWKIEEEWQFAPKKNLTKPEEFNGFEKWKETSLLFERLQREFPERFYLVNYDDLLNNTRTTVTDLFTFANLELSNQTQGFLTKSRSTSVQDAYGVFKKKEKDDSWKKDLPEYIIEEIKKDSDFVALNKRFNWS